MIGTLPSNTLADDYPTSFISLNYIKMINNNEYPLSSDSYASDNNNIATLTTSCSCTSDNNNNIISCNSSESFT